MGHVQNIDALMAALANPQSTNCTVAETVADAITADAQSIGLNLPIFSGVDIQVVGGSNGAGGMYKQTEYVLSGASQAQMDDFIRALPGLGFVSNESNWLVGDPHSGYTGNWRQDQLAYSMQINTNRDAGRISIDIDPWNPAAAYGLGLILHGIDQAGPNTISGTDTNYMAAARYLKLNGRCK